MFDLGLARFAGLFSSIYVSPPSFSVGDLAMVKLTTELVVKEDWERTCGLGITTLDTF